MIVAAWVVFCLFSFLCLLSLLTIFSSNKKTDSFWFMLYFEIMVSAISSGIIWGGLFQ